MSKLNETTTKCLVCLEPATVFGGNVIDENGDQIIAGWCKEHSDIPVPKLMNTDGCYGGYHKSYGKKRWMT